MPTTTSGIWSPDSGDDYSLTTDLAAMAASIETATNKTVNDRAAKQGSAISTYAAMPMTGNTAGDTRITTDTRIVWMWDGTRWIAIGGKLPWAHALTAADTALSTSAAAISFASGSSSGAHAGTNFTVPEGCNGLYQINFGARITPNERNMIVGFYNGGSLIQGTEATSGGQDWITRSCVVNLTAGAVITVRARVFSGSGTILAGASLDVSYLHAT